MKKLFYNFDGKDRQETIELFDLLLKEGKHLKTTTNSAYMYEQYYYLYNDVTFIVTKRDGEYIYIERVIYHNDYPRENIL